MTSLKRDKHYLKSHSTKCIISTTATVIYLMEVYIFNFIGHVRLHKINFNIYLPNYPKNALLISHKNVTTTAWCISYCVLKAPILKVLQNVF
jgi:hypothetical protein